MPFINDLIDANKEAATEKKHKSHQLRSSRFLFDPNEVLEKLKAHIIGQEAVMTSLDGLLHFIKADFASPSRPLGVCLLAGPTGVGKTQTVKLLAEYLTANADQLCRIDMNTLAQEHYSASITGAPPGYVGSKDGHSLFDEEKIKGTYSKPGIVLFDEIEKADTSVKRALLNIMDSGELTLTAGNKTIDFKNALIFFTSNLGADKIKTYEQKFKRGWRLWFRLKPSEEKKYSLRKAELEKHFDPEFINRIDYTLHYQTINHKDLPALIALSIDQLRERLAKKAVQLTVDHTVIHFLAQQYDMQYGARDINRLIRTQLETVLAKALINFPENVKFFVDLSNQSIRVMPESM